MTLLILCTCVTFYYPLLPHWSWWEGDLAFPILALVAIPLNTEDKEGIRKVAYPQEGEVSVVLDAGDFQVAHHYLAVLIVLAQGPILLLQIREGAQLVLGASTHCKKP